MPRYYDVDSVLAEEELVPCSTLFDFSFLAHLDPDLPEQEHKLPEGSRIKLPLWAMRKWAMMGFVRLSLPRHFQRKARERIEAEPAEVDLRKRNERFFLSGIALVNLIDASSKQVAKAIAGSGARSARRNSHLAALEAVKLEADELRKTLLLAYTGDRLGHTLDWSLSSVGDDVTAFTGKLTEMERRLFACGATAIANQTRWRLYGNKRFVVRKAAPVSERDTNREAPTRDNKRQRTQ